MVHLNHTQVQVSTVAHARLMARREHAKKISGKKVSLNDVIVDMLDATEPK